ncbi:hypothetical protein HYH03_016698 [Edaphochlamys debaryana]|uniref:Uncharacterized protein n=1 Tax=Edaphochlamys debaryana TaxID=47281 RepID=A0A835XKG1_9CHLO|nr:hypothetical protein HYH03_016698 [Edaphochlamys debaryana]|eukprot:KAG2484463.1 hypothetical protein HYH03_016698 [Edaphochlamys debaryana]
MSFPANHRPSILHRPLRAEPSRATEETFETQYQREQALLRAKQERQAETRDRLVRALNPGPEDKAAAWDALVASNSLLASRQPGRGSYEEQLPSPSGPQGVVPEGVRPWSHVMATQHVSVAEEEAARRRFAEEVAAENLRITREREAARYAEMQERRQPAVQDSWYARGDTHRLAEPLFSGDGVPRPGTASAMQRPPSAYSPGAGGVQRPSTAAPWATYGGDAEVLVVRPPQAFAPGPGQAHPGPGQAPAEPAWQPKAQERQYPWSWKA